MQATQKATVRDRSANALVLSVAGITWLGWAQGGASSTWAPALVVGSVAGAAVAIAAATLTWRHRAGASAMGRASGHASYLRVVGLEVALIGLGAMALGATNHPGYISPWILLVVGVHFLPLASLFGIGSLRVCGMLEIAVAVTAAVVGLLTDLRPSVIAGSAGGLLMVAFAAYSAQSVWRGQMRHQAHPVRAASR